MEGSSSSRKVAAEVAAAESVDRPRRKAGPARKDGGRGVKDVIQTLYSEHRHFESLLEKLEAEAAKLKPGRIPDYHLLLDIVDYLTHYPDRYHHPREDLLFNSMLKRNPTFRGKLDRLLREHETLHYYNDQLFRELTRAVRGASVDRPELLDSITQYIRGYRGHMEFESSEIFPEARGTLSAADMENLASRTRYLDDPLFGDRVQHQYRRLNRSLQARLGDVAEELVSREMSVVESAIENVASAAEKLNGLRQNLPVPECRGGLLQRTLSGGFARFSQRPSWQARALNTCTRLLIKPMMQLGSIENMRAMTASMEKQRARSAPEKGVRIEPVSTGDYDGEWVRIANRRPRRTLLYFPGGAFVMRTALQHRAFVVRICREADARALIVHYRLAPEVPFPGGLEDCLAAYHSLLEQGTDPESITVAGDSAGGGLVLSTLLALRDEGSPMPGGAIVLSPLGDLTYTGKSREFNARRDPMLPTHRASQMHQLYLGEALPQDRYLSPVLADFDGLPPMLGQVGSTEILLDDTVRASIQAEKAGVPFYLEIWRELPHVFPIFEMLPESQAALKRIANFIVSREVEPLPAKYGSSDRNFGRPRRAHWRD